MIAARSTCLFLLLGLALVACRSTPKSAPSVSRYIVTTAPIDVGVVSNGLCVAVDPADPRGVWWWEPGRSGCSSRSTGPGVFHAERASVVRPPRSGAIDVQFRLPLHSTTPGFADIGLVLQDDGMQARASGVRVPTERRNDLDVPE